MLLVGGAILLAIVLSSFLLARTTQVYFEDVVKLRELRSAAADMQLFLRAAESGQRGFVLTQDAEFLIPYTTASAVIPRLRERLKTAAGKLDAVHVPFAELDPLIDDKLAEMQSTVEMVQKGNAVGAIEVIRGAYGRQLMEGITTILGTLLRDTDGRIGTGVDDLNDSATALQWITIGGGLMIILVIGGAIMIVGQHVHELQRARSEVEELNAGLEERVNERSEDLIQANREIQRYAYIVSHDLRAPLVNIMGFTSELDASLKSISTYVLADGTPLSETDVNDARVAVEQDLPEAIAFIRSSTKKMDGLINAILKISRDGRRELKPERIDLGELLEATAASIYHQVSEAGGEVNISVAQARGLITDRFSLEQIFGNLFDNAVKYKHPDRPLNLSVKAMPLGRAAMRIEVSDNGRGIAQEDHERVFELFRRSGVQDQQGEGIGLAHVRSLVRNLGGEITVTSTLGGGTTFVIRLPTDLSHYVRSNGS
ncbi:Putative two-component sensor histidine kinase [Neorhizobium galegae bv. officinalis bv. officinalis str. HAMBI 1141]|uniref:histidine kinase n=2 Tax=Neorhizobium galegae TaxID=399 RepID=A0A068T9Z2_NEOGA|nr:Putative two-component sensor histidine kinase [Neorhizobium galegae bv. officinalis bv. officinalis str. HAMBI 1141]